MTTLYGKPYFPLTPANNINEIVTIYEDTRFWTTSNVINLWKTPCKFSKEISTQERCFCDNKFDKYCSDYNEMFKSATTSVSLNTIVTTTVPAQKGLLKRNMKCTI